jgi:hypothetical protein
MGRFVVIVVGPAGAGKSTFCKVIQDHSQTMRRTVHIGNLDPAADHIQYQPAFDIRDLITIEEAMDGGAYGPNGALVRCMEHLLEHHEWLQEELDSFSDDEYVFLDCPGQVELYSHLRIMSNLVHLIESWGYRATAVHVLDALFLLEPWKFISGCMLSLSCLVQLRLPFVGVISKCDIADRDALERMLDCGNSESILLYDCVTSGRLKDLTRAIGSVIDDHMMLSFVLLNIEDEESINDVVLKIDMCSQYGEDLEPRMRDEEEEVDQIDR